MPRASSATKDARTGGFGIQDGDYLFEDSAFKFHQYPAATKGENAGQQSPMFFCFEGVLRELDEDLDPVSDNEEDLIREQWPIMWPSKKKFEESGTYEGLFNLRPGAADDEDDEDPTDVAEDEGYEPDVSGNSMFAEDPEKTMFKDCDFYRLTESLENAGFKSEVLERSYAPDFVGLKVRFKTIELPKPSNWKKEYAPTALVVESIHNLEEMPNHGGKKGGKTSKKKAGKKKAGKKAAAKTSGKGKSSEGGSGTSEEDIQELFNEVTAAVKEKVKGEDISTSDFRKKVLFVTNQAKTPAPQKNILMPGLKDEEQLVVWAEESGLIEVDTESGTISFA